MLIYDSRKLVDFSYTLSRLHKAALPNAIRFTLNDSAIDMKKRTISKQANASFKVAKPNFFKVYSRFEKAKGYDIRKMQSKAGIIKSSNLNQKASTELAQQPIAGKVKHKSFRASKNMQTSKGLVKSTYKKLRKKKPITTNKANYVKDAKLSKESGRPLLIKKNNKGILVKVNSIKRKGKDRIKTTPVANYNKRGIVDLKRKRPFIENAAKESAKLLDENFIKNATKQIKRFQK